MRTTVLQALVVLGLFLTLPWTMVPPAETEANPQVGETPFVFPATAIQADFNGTGGEVAAEWWDAALLVDGASYGGDVLREKITLYVEHPVPLAPPAGAEAPAPAPQPLKLTKAEQKKLRTQRRVAREQEKQEMIRQGLLEPPKPKVKISNLMRVLTDTAAADPTAIEKEVRAQMAERAEAHEDRNLARALTPADAALARRMLEIGERVAAREIEDGAVCGHLSEKKTETTRFGYHLPPFNSVVHLHMHAFALPFEPAWKERKYSVEPWARFAFEPAGETVARLERESRQPRQRATPKL